MELAFLVILIAALTVGIVVLVSMGVRQRRRQGALARVAHELGMKFSPGDPFDVTRRYGSFVWSSAGHSPRADNVIYGRYEGFYLRAFDFRYEAGHGPGRIVRRYSVIVADTDLDFPPALLWHGDDADHLPLAVQEPIGQVGRWRVIRGGRFAPVLSEAFAPFADEPASVQTDGRSVMVCSAAPWRPRELVGRFARAASALRVLQERRRP